MKKKRPVLFVGNGIAQRIQIAEKWDKIINDTAKIYGVNISQDILKKLPYNMQIVAASNDNVDKAMIGLSERLKSITLNDEQKAFTKRALELPFTDILTTNYTYELERSVSDHNLNPQNSLPPNPCGFVPMDLDVTPFDKSKSHKEGEKDYDKNYEN